MLCPQSNASGSFLQTCIYFAEQRLKFPHFEGSILPSKEKRANTNVQVFHKLLEAAVQKSSPEKGS